MWKKRRLRVKNRTKIFSVIFFYFILEWKDYWEYILVEAKCLLRIIKMSCCSFNKKGRKKNRILNFDYIYGNEVEAHKIKYNQKKGLLDF